MGSVVAGKSNDDIIQELVDKILSNIPEKLNKEEGQKELFIKNA